MQKREQSPKADFSRNNLVNIASRVIADNHNQINAGELTPLFSQGRWSKIAEALRTYPVDVQKQIAVGFFGPEGGNFPNGESFARFLVRLNNINWFRPINDPDHSQLQETVNGITDGLDIARRRLELTDDYPGVGLTGVNTDLSNKVDMMEIILKTMIKETGETSFSVALNAVKGCVEAAKKVDVGNFWGYYDADLIASIATADIAYLAKIGASWEIGQDLIQDASQRAGKGQQINPTNLFFDIYEQGAIPIEVTRQEFIVIWPHV